jgi:hypothetical protein
MYIIKLTSLITLIYCTLSTTVERNKYPLNLRNQSLQEFTTKKSSYKKTENTKKSIFRRKIWIDLKYHKRKQNFNTENTIQVLINKEGKILGYKLCNICYPNYFTRKQPKTIIKTSKKFKYKKIKLCILNFKMQ